MFLRGTFEAGRSQEFVQSYRQECGHQCMHVCERGTLSQRALSGRKTGGRAPNVTTRTFLMKS